MSYHFTFVMNPLKNQTEGEIRADETQNHASLNNVLSLNRTRQVRQEIGIIADRSLREHIISDEAYSGYRAVAEGREQSALSVEMLESTRKFAREHEAKAIRVHSKILRARTAKIASENDEEFLMENLVVDNMQFLEKSGEVEKLIDEKLERMRIDKKKYDMFAGHRLIKNIGYLKVNASKKINFPSEEEYLEMTVPERRALLKSLEDAMPKAEVQANASAEKKDTKLSSKYEKKLGQALADKIIGKKTAQKFRDGFAKIDQEDKYEWLQEFDAQMARYETLWSQVREGLQGEALRQMESKLDQLGYTELFSLFGQIRSTEGAKLGTTYAKEIEKYREKGVIGRYTVNKFNLWMTQQNLAKKYDAIDSIESEMARYEDLWEEVGALKPKQQAFMRSKIDNWGYSELHSQLQQFKTGKNMTGETGAFEAEKKLSQIKSMEVQGAIKETDELLDAEGAGKRATFINMLGNMFGKQSSANFDAISFEGQIRDRARSLDPNAERDKKGKAASASVDLKQIKEDAELLEAHGGADVFHEDGFIEVESVDAQGKRVRDTQLQINDKKSMEHFFNENASHGYKSELDGGNDDLSFSIWGEGGRTVEMTLHEIKVLEDYLKKKDAVKDDNLEAAA